MWMIKTRSVSFHIAKLFEILHVGLLVDERSGVSLHLHKFRENGFSNNQRGFKCCPKHIFFEHVVIDGESIDKWRGHLPDGCMRRRIGNYRVRQGIFTPNIGRNIGAVLVANPQNDGAIRSGWQVPQVVTAFFQPPPILDGIFIPFLNIRTGDNWCVRKRLGPTHNASLISSHLKVRYSDKGKIGGRLFAGVRYDGAHVVKGQHKVVDESLTRCLASFGK
mmetsp:Transcript_14695/g.33290  ORF Transcript_14695/g.33290 Transcript_14695/m.33290 type:complete len:220 (-) Transcript_14695:2233-2892(-)